MHENNDMQLVELNKAVNEMLDREAIRQLPITYCHYVRTKNVEALVDLFTADGEIFAPENMGQEGTGAKGLAALTVFYEKGLEVVDPWPFIHNHHIIMLGNGRANGYVYAEFRSGNKGYRTTAIGVYDDDYEKQGGVWKFRSRKLASTLVVGN